MRILITKLGDEVIKSIAEEKENNINTQSKSKNKQQKNFNDTNKSNKSFISNKNKTLNSSFGKTKLTSNDNDNNSIIMSSKIIQIKQKKINIPKNITDRYNTNSDTNTNLILPSLTLPKFKDKTSTNFNNTQNNLNTTSNFTQNKNEFTFKDVLPDETYVSLKCKLEKDKKLKDKLSRIDENQFRSIFGQKSNSEKLDDMLMTNINLDKVNLIKYLNEKNDISDVLIKRLSEYSEDKINKVNKICQIVFFNEERSKIYKERIKDRINSKQNREKTEYKTCIESLGDGLNEVSDIFKEYKKPGNEREKYRDIHNDTINKFWRKYQVSRYDKKKNMINTQSAFGDFYGRNFTNKNEFKINEAKN